MFRGVEILVAEWVSNGGWVGMRLLHEVGVEAGWEVVVEYL